jgi:SNF2 family DNA or RNA helicase
MAVLKMGAGKSAAVLTAIEELIGDGVIRHALVVAPKRVAQMVWPAEIEGWEHLRHLKYAVLDGGPTERLLKLADAHKRDITIIGIDNVQWLVEQLDNAQAENPIWGLLVIDETSKLKDPTSKRGKALARIAGRFKLRWGMTGTPVPNSLLDLFTPMKVISNGQLWGKSFYKWQRQHFYPADRNGYRWNVLPGHDAGILADAASLSIALGEHEMPDLPELTILVDEVTLPAAARVQYRQMESRLFARLDTADILAMSRAVATGKLAQLANGFIYDEDGAEGTHAVHAEKSAWLEELVTSLDGEPLLLVYEFKEDLEMIRRVCGDDVPYLGAGVSDKTAQQRVEAWNRGELPLFALHPASGGHGLNLQHGGSRMAWIAPTWSAEMWDQTIARIHRPGQRAHCMVHVCVASHTVDDLKRLRVFGKLSAQEAFEAYLASVQGRQAA